MVPAQSSLIPAILFKCASLNCGRYYGKRYGYFSLLPAVPPAPEEIDPANRRMKVCAIKRQTHSYMAITRPKNTGPGAKDLWRWYCYECNKKK
jgi:hypothetical protein